MRRRGSEGVAIAAGGGKAVKLKLVSSPRQELLRDCWRC